MTRTSLSVWKTRRRPATTSSKSARNSGLRWWKTGRAAAASTSGGTGVGPGVIRYVFSGTALLRWIGRECSHALRRAVSGGSPARLRLGRGAGQGDRPGGQAVADAAHDPPADQRERDAAED